MLGLPEKSFNTDAATQNVFTNLREDNSKDRTGVDSQETGARNQNMRRWEAAARAHGSQQAGDGGASEPRDRPPERRLHEQDRRHARRLGTCGQDSGRVRSSSPRRRPPGRTAHERPRPRLSVPADPRRSF